MSRDLAIERFLLRLLRVSPRPEPPPGALQSAEPFRAAPGYLRYLLFAWGRRQIGAAIGIVVSFFFLGLIESPESRERWAIRFGGPEGAVEMENAIETAREEVGIVDAGLSILESLADIPFYGDQVSLLLFFEYLAVVAFVLQLFTGWFLVRLRWRMRWYFVSDRALRIREGIWKLSEKTLTLANIQNTKISQGPLQKLFGIADLEVQTAGGGSDLTADKDHHLHVGVLRGLDHVDEVQALIRTALGKVRDAGLGDPDEKPWLVSSAVAEGGMPSRVDAQLGNAARRLLDASRGLRSELDRST